MIYYRWHVLVCFVIMVFSAGAQENYTGRLITTKGTLWQGRITRDTLHHTYIILTPDTQVVFQEADVSKVTSTLDSYTSDDDQEEHKAPRVYFLPYTDERRNDTDYIITKKGDVYKGWVTEDHIKVYVIMHLPDSSNITVSYKDIRRVNYSNTTWLAMQHKEARYKQSESASAKLDGVDKMHNLGLGLTISGGVLIAIGVPLIIAGAPQATTVTAPGYAGVRLTGAGAVGVLFSLAGTGLLIPGAIKLAKYVRLHKQMQRKAAGNL